MLIQYSCLLRPRVTAGLKLGTGIAFERDCMGKITLLRPVVTGTTAAHASLIVAGRSRTLDGIGIVSLLQKLQQRFWLDRIDLRLDMRRRM